MNKVSVKNWFDKFSKSSWNKTVADGVKTGDLEYIENMFDILNVTDKQGNTPLINAVLKGNMSLVSKLLAAGADIDAQGQNGYTPLMNAACKGNDEIVELLLSYRANPDIQSDLGNSALSVAIFNDKEKSAIALIKSGADVNLSNKKGDTPLIYSASSSKRANITQPLIDAGADLEAVNADGYSALWVSARNSNNPVANILIAAGADIHKKSDYFGNTVFLEAAENGNAALVKDLIQAGADVNDQNRYGHTALMICAKFGSYSSGSSETAKVLIAAGADLNIKDNEGQTARFHSYAGNTPFVRKQIEEKIFQDEQKDNGKMKKRDDHTVTIQEKAKEGDFDLRTIFNFKTKSVSYKAVSGPAEVVHINEMDFDAAANQNQISEAAAFLKKQNGNLYNWKAKKASGLNK